MAEDIVRCIHFPFTLFGRLHDVAHFFRYVTEHIFGLYGFLFRGRRACAGANLWLGGAVLLGRVVVDFGMVESRTIGGSGLRDGAGAIGCRSLDGRMA